MIENMRYFISGDRIIVKWNWLGANTMVATCRLVKRLNGKEVACKNDITMQAYWNEHGGCSFEMPNVPVRVELTDSTQDEWITADVWESPQYRIQVKLEYIPWEERKGFRRRTGDRMKITVTYPDTLEDDELGDIEGWILCGRPKDARSEERFFLPRPTSKKMTISAFKITEDDKGKDYQFEIVPEVKGTKFERMFTVNVAAADAQGRAAQCNCASLDFRALGERDDAGHYKIVCPYCFEELDYSQPVFRAQAYENPNDGYPAENDNAYDDFCSKKGISNAEGAKGKILEWDEKEIRFISYSDDPNTKVPYKSGAEKNGVVVAVVDGCGNATVEKVCPKCHHTIPLYSGLYPNVFISMMGNTGSGKTVYLASMLNMLRSGNLLPGFNFDCRVCRNTRSQEIEKAYEVLIEGHEDEGNAVVAAQIPNSQPAMPVNNVFTMAGDEPDIMQPLASASTPETSPFADASSLPTYDDPFDGAMDGNAGFSMQAADPVEPEEEIQADEINTDQLDFAPVAEATQEDPMNNAKPLPQATPRKYQDPCIYELIGTDPNTGEKCGFSLSFFDFPGEAIWQTQAALTANDHYLIKMLNLADGMVFLFDPSSISYVQALPDNLKRRFFQLTLPGKEETNLHTLLSKSPNEILKSFCDKYMVGKTKLNIPVAMVISKSDAIRDWLKHADPKMRERDTSFLEESVYTLDRTRTGVNLGEIQANSNAIIDFLGDQALQDRCKLICDNFLWVCASATGIAPDSRGTLFQRHGVPVHLLDPIEWILYRAANR